MWIRLSEVELSDGVIADCIVEFDCISRGYPATYWEPGEGPEFEITDAYVEEAWGETWTKTRREMGDWVQILDERFNEIVDDYPDLYELQYDEFHYGGE